jgi:hypothetical protein
MISPPKKTNKPEGCLHHIQIGGGGERVRTDDLLRARQALSQLSYTPLYYASRQQYCRLQGGGPGWS